MLLMYLQLGQEPRLSRGLIPLGVRAHSEVPSDGVHGLRVTGGFLPNEKHVPIKLPLRNTPAKGRIVL